MKPGADNTIRKTAAQWAAETRVHLEGTKMYETDTGWFKISDGVQTFAAMGADAYFKPEGDLTGGGGQTPVGIPYTFSDTTSAAGIAAGTFRLDNANFGSATKLYIHDTDGLAYDQSDYWDLFTSGVITLHRSSPEGYVTFKVTRMVAQTGYHEFDVVRVGGATGFTNADEIRLAVTMDAPGVRTLVASVIIGGGGAWGEVHQDSLKELPSVWVSGNQIIITSTGNFPINKCHGTGSAINANNDGAVAVGFVEGGAPDEVYFFLSGETNGTVNIYLQVYN